MQITATQTFLHGRDRYEDGETYDVPDHLAGYFVAVGWATSDDIETPQEERLDIVDLDVADGRHTSTTKER